jgi:hypothetical protein
MACCVLSCCFGPQPTKATETATATARVESLRMLDLLETVSESIAKGGGDRQRPAGERGRNALVWAAMVARLHVARVGLRPRPFSRVAGLAGLAFSCVTFSGACNRGDPPAPPVSPSVAFPESAPPSPASSLPQSQPSSRPSSQALSRQLADGDAGAAAPDGQTHDRPVASGPAFDARARALWEAIVADDPDRAMPFFFPLEAYAQVKDVADPAADWKHRLVAAYRRDIHALHARLATEANGAVGDAHLIALSVPEGHAGWVEPGEEWNKLGYYRVFGTRLRYAVDGDGTDAATDTAGGARERSFEVKSLISWRGEWFVVHLSAIR